MCKRSQPDPLVRIFLERYRVNLLSMPGSRVHCGSVYIKRGPLLTAPGDLADLLEPALQLPPAHREDELPALLGSWSGQVSLNVGIGLLKNFLLALGAPALIDKLQAGAKRRSTRSVSFCFKDATRESLSPTALGLAIEGHRLRASNPWIVSGNSYFVAAAVLRSRSISIRLHDDAGTAVDLGADIATVLDAEARVDVTHGENHVLTYTGQEPLGFAVELYQLSWDDDNGTFVFDTPRGALPLTGFKAGDAPEPVFIGDDEEALIAVSQPAGKD